MPEPRQSVTSEDSTQYGQIPWIQTSPHGTELAQHAEFPSVQGHRQSITSEDSTQYGQSVTSDDSTQYGQSVTSEDSTQDGQCPWINSFANPYLPEQLYVVPPYQPDPNLPEQEIDMLMMSNTMATSWQDAELPLSAICVAGNSCFKIALERFQEVTTNAASRAYPCGGLPGSNPLPTLEIASLMSRKIISSVGTILTCTCSLNWDLLPELPVRSPKLVSSIASPPPTHPIPCH
jgi:hypothetical protein